ncbi:MAG: DUF4340 domain-containing protein [Cyclobacteriaceae bacterium]|nr:DUF4340 domain-containing protein [Cyclobacteriaceae bacterium]
MQEKRNIQLLISWGVLMAVAGVLLYLGNAPSHELVDKDLFRVVDQTEVDHFTIQKSGSELIEIRFDGSKWMVNNSFEADRQLITVFFATLLQAEPKRAVATGQRDSISQEINQHGVQVKLYIEDEVVQDFKVIGNDRKTETYFQLNQDNTPYLVTIPGYRVYVGSVFELTPGEWRDRRIFNFNWQNFKSLSLSHLDSKNNFTVSFQDQFFGIEGLSQADTTRLNDFLDAVSLLQASRFIELNDTLRWERSRNQQPEFSIQVLDIANREYALEIFPRVPEQSSVLGRINRQTLALFSAQDIARIARKRMDFKR